MPWVVAFVLGLAFPLLLLTFRSVIRGILPPAAMKLLGEWNWWMARRLGWLPTLTPEPGRRGYAAGDWP